MFKQNPQGNAFFLTYQYINPLSLKSCFEGIAISSESNELSVKSIFKPLLLSKIFLFSSTEINRVKFNRQHTHISLQGTNLLLIDDKWPMTCDSSLRIQILFENNIKLFIYLVYYIFYNKFSNTDKYSDKWQMINTSPMTTDKWHLILLNNSKQKRYMHIFK